MKRPELIGIACQYGDGVGKEQRCYGTFREDMPDASFRFNILFVKHDGDFKMHSHQYSEVGVVLGGRGIHVTDFGSHPLAEGDVFVIHNEIRHGFRDARDLKLCNIQYDSRQFLHHQRALRCIKGYHELFDLEWQSRQPGRFGACFHLSAEELGYVISLLGAMKLEFDGRCEGREVIIRSTFLLLVAHLSRLFCRQKQGEAIPHARMARVILHIQKRFREPLRVGELARLAHFSPSQFQRTFKRTYNTTPKQCILQLRLHEACELLKDPGRDITTIAYDVGFSSSSFFAAQFKRHIGESPSQYRRRMQCPGARLAGN